MTCRDCGNEFEATAGKPGYINQCSGCSADVPVYEAGDSHDESGSCFDIGLGLSGYRADRRKRLIEELKEQGRVVPFHIFGEERGTRDEEYR